MAETRVVQNGPAVKFLEIPEVAGIYHMPKEIMIFEAPRTPDSSQESGEVSALRQAAEAERYQARRRVFQAAVDEIAQKERAQQKAFWSETKVYQKALRERKEVEAIPYDAITFPCIQLDLLGDRLYVLPNKKLFLGGVERRVRFCRDDFPRWTQSRASFTICNSLYVGPMPPEVTERYEKAKQWFGAQDIVVVSTRQDYFSMAENRIDPLARWEPIMLGFKNGQSFFICAWDWEKEDDDILKAK